MNRLTLTVVLGAGVAIIAWLSCQSVWLDSQEHPAPVAPVASAAVVGGAAGGTAKPASSAAVDLKGKSVGENVGGGLPEATIEPALIGSSEALDPGILSDAPKSVRFGVVLVQYKGAQGASPKTRAKKAAIRLATELSELAAEDFAAAVKQGDPGSVKNAGRMYRGILEPGPELALFKLKKGEVSPPIDTPRGFWVVKRLK